MLGLKVVLERVDVLELARVGVCLWERSVMDVICL
jgi:hypothetical protein